MSEPSGEASPSEPSPNPDAAPIEAAPSGEDVSPRRRRRPLTRGKKALFFLTFAVLGLGFGELVVRVLTKPKPPMFEAHPYLRRVRAESVSHEWISPIDGRAFTVSSDAHGFRTKNLEPVGEPKPEGTYRIFFVGGSTTENIALPDEETFPDLVQVALRKRLGTTPRVCTINTGISGNTIVDSFSLISHRVLALEPDLIVVLHATNDMRISMSDRFDPTHYRDLKKHKKVRFGDFMEDNSRLYSLSAQLRKGLFGTSGADRYKKRRAAIPFTKDADPSVGLPHFRRYLSMISAVCAEAKVPVVFMTQPSLYKPNNTPEEDASFWLGVVNHGEINLDNATLMKGMQLYNAATTAHAKERGHLLIDLEPAVPKDLEHFYDGAHYTAKGCAVIADEIVKALLQGGKLPE
jgi:GDSL-like lipase/acylhydrolase family protein